MQKLERKMTATVRHVLTDWVAAERRRSTPSSGDIRFFGSTYQRFTDWLTKHRIAQPASGYAVAAFLLELADRGDSVQELARVADGIAFHYALDRLFLDVGPVNALLAFLAAEVSPSRTLH